MKFQNVVFTQHLKHPADFFQCYSEMQGFVFTASSQEENKRVGAAREPHKLTVCRLHCVPSIWNRIQQLRHARQLMVVVCVEWKLEEGKCT